MAKSKKFFVYQIVKRDAVLDLNAKVLYQDRILSITREEKKIQERQTYCHCGAPAPKPDLVIRKITLELTK